MASHSRYRRLLRRRPRIQRRTAPGAMPGTLVPHPEANVSQVHVVQYGPTEMHERDVESVAHIPAASPKMPVVWINVDGLSNVALLNQLAARYELHPLAMEDVVNVHQRPKVEFYDKFLFLVARMARLGEGQLEAEQVRLPIRAYTTSPPA